MSVVFERPRLTVPVSERDHVLGPATAPVTLVEYGDYECPYLRRGASERQAGLGVMGTTCGSCSATFRCRRSTRMPTQAAEAAEAAGAQGEFWEMHDLLFENQDRLGLRDLIGYAARTRSRP